MKLRIKGKNNLQTSINISGAKNSAVAIIPAAILSDEEVILYNIPKITDVFSSISILEDLGYKCDFDNHTLSIKQIKPIDHVIKNELAQSLRGSYYFYGALIGKCGKVDSFLPGGCQLGLRPINYHIDGFKKLNCKVNIINNRILIETDNLIGNTIDIPTISVGATINIILASIKATGTTIINNYSKEPEVIDTIEFLKSMGSIINYDDHRITIQGVKKLNGTTYTIIPDRIEAGSYLLMGCLPCFDYVILNNINPNHLTSVIEIIRQIGGNIKINDSSIKVTSPKVIKNCNITTGPYPLFPTDLGQILTSVLINSPYESTITETIFSNRFSHIPELIKMNANITLEGNRYIIRKTPNLYKATVMCHDLRCSFALFMACLCIKDFSVIENVELIFRGYNEFIEKLINLNIEFLFID